MRAAPLRLTELPLLVVLLGVAAAAMLVPAGFALAAGLPAQAGPFARAALLTGAGAAILGAATLGYRPHDAVRSQILSLVGAYALLPPVLALPVAEALPGFGFAGAWYEMVSSFTTTGATLLADPAAVPDTVHLWNALVGWLGGFFVLLAAMAVLAPMNLGGMELMSPAPVGRSAFTSTPIHTTADPARRLIAALRVVGPLYAALTGVLWVGLLIAGTQPFAALCHAMGILSTSGISPVGGLEAAGGGRLAEALMLGFLVFAVTRRSLPGLPLPGERRRFHRDPELRAAVYLVGGLAVALLLALLFRGAAPLEALRAGWGALFTLASFLTTTGYVSADWAVLTGGQGGAAAPLLLLAGLAMLGGGVATTAGGIKLMRVLALIRHGQHEMEKLLDPALVGGGGPRARHLRGDGAYRAWVFFMLFVLSLAAVSAALTLAGRDLVPALVLALGALSTAGPIIELAEAASPVFGGLTGMERGILAVAMVLGRLELLALVVLLVPDAWRR